MKLSISKKFCKRSIKCLSMFAPLAYLFGALFFGLNGAHGQTVFAQDDNQSYSVDLPVTAGIEYNRDTGEIESTSSQLYYGLLSYFAVSEENTYTISIPSTASIRVFWYDDQYLYTRSSGAPSFEGADGFIRFHIYSPTDVISSVNIAVNGPYVPASVDASAYSDYVFGQFFAKDNFLEQWGENAISDNPKGFAPFGTFLQYIDENMLHLSDSQIGLMAYGYLYYTLHVLIAFFAFDILGFIPLFLQRVTDKIGGTEDD